VILCFCEGAPCKALIMGELYRPPQIHSENRKYFGVFGAVNFWQTVDGTVVSELEKSAFRDIECDSCGPASPRSLHLRIPVCARGRQSSARVAGTIRWGPKPTHFRPLAAQPKPLRCKTSTTIRCVCKAAIALERGQMAWPRSCYFRFSVPSRACVTLRNGDDGDRCGSGCGYGEGGAQHTC
jgi:hypothetical protein